MDFTTVVAAPAIAAMHERSAYLDKRQDRTSRANMHSLHAMQEDLMKKLFSVECKVRGERNLEVSHAHPLQQKLMRKLFSDGSSTETSSTRSNLVVTNPRPLRQQAEPKLKISLRRKITDSANCTWQRELSEEGDFVFEEVL